MGNTGTDPVDHARTTRQHAGEAMKNGANAAGIAAIALGVIALVVGLFALAAGYPLAAATAVILAAALCAGGFVWLARTHRRVRAQEVRWQEVHSDEPAPPPSS
jgi:hypothetical protein